MHEGRRLSRTQMRIRDEIADEVIHHYRLELADGRVLAVRMPGELSQNQAIEIVDHLRELAFAVSTSEGLSEHEPLAREELSKACSDLRHASQDVVDLDSARTLLDSYARFREAVANYVRYARR